MNSAMQELVIQNPAMNSITHPGRQDSDTSFGCESHSEVKNTRQNTIKSVLIWLLVGYGLIQVTSNLIISKHNHQHRASPAMFTLYCQVPAMCSHFLKQDTSTDVTSPAPSASINLNRAIVMQNDYPAVDQQAEESNTITEHESQGNDKSRHSHKSTGTLLTTTAHEELAFSCISTYNSFAYYINSLWARFNSRSFGSGVLLADAAQLTTSSMYQTSHDREIIVLNSTNFNTELIQHSHPFPHVKLIEYYLPYCRICLRFKQTYIQLSKEIFSWRNVIRTSAIDLGVSNNSPIAQSWSIDVIPSLRIHPPPKKSLAAKLNHQLLAWSSSMQVDELQRSMYQEYNGANLMISSLGVIKYTNDSKRDSVSDKVELLKHDLIRYIDRFVRSRPDEVPKTWPNLLPVSEKTILELKRNHPRQELFLIVESGSNNPLLSGTDSPPSLGLQIIMELSSSAPWKAIRYVRAGDNKDLIEDVIAYKEKKLHGQADGQVSDPDSTIREQIELLKNLLHGNSGDNNKVILIRTDDSYPLSGYSADVLSTKFSFLDILTTQDFIQFERQLVGIASLKDTVNVDKRSKRTLFSRHENNSNVDIIERNTLRSLHKRSDNEDSTNLSVSRQIELLTSYINQTYVPTSEDKAFVTALNSFDENPTAFNSKKLAAVDEFQAAQQENQLLSSLINESQRKPEVSQNNSTAKGIFHKLNPANCNSFLSQVINDACQFDDYEDKLKAIRYIFIHQVTRQSSAHNSSSTGTIEKLNTLINLASVIKAYFPLPDLASVQFIDAAHDYLSKQQTLLLASLSGRDLNPNNLNLGTLKRVFTNIEVDGKHLPEITGWKHCIRNGYPCALWRLFHTLTAFEYKKLSQIYQLPAGSQSSTIASLETNHPTAQQQRSQPQAQNSDLPVTDSVSSEQQQNSPPSQIERLVSPPSTTTSLSLTIATPISSHGRSYGGKTNAGEVAELPMPVLLVIRDYVANFFECSECVSNFLHEAQDLSFERIRQEPAEFSILWLWEAHNRISKLLSINPATNPPVSPTEWFPNYQQCSKCYKKPPSYLRDTSVTSAAVFQESIEWNRDEVLNFLQREFTKQPMDTNANFFGYSLPYGFNYLIIIGICLLLLIILIRCASCYIERQRRHKASMLNGVQYSEELQRN